MYPMYEDFMLSCLPCNLCKKGEAPDAYESITGLGGAHTCVLLRETFTSTSFSW